MELSKLSVAELRQLQEQVREELAHREHQEVAKAREQILAIAHSVGIPLKDLLAVQSREKAKVAVRYRHPADATLHWSGRGRQPRWIKEWLEAGHSMDSLNA